MKFVHCIVNHMVMDDMTTRYQLKAFRNGIYFIVMVIVTILVVISPNMLTQKMAFKNG